MLFHDKPAGVLSETEEGYEFLYYPEYTASSEAEPISLTMPKRTEPYTGKTMFPFFDGLIPEGWLLDIAEKTGKLMHAIAWGFCLPAAAIVSEL